MLRRMWPPSATGYSAIKSAIERGVGKSSLFNSILGRSDIDCSPAEVQEPNSSPSIVEEPPSELADPQHTRWEDDIIKSSRSNSDAQETNSERLEKVIQQLRALLTTSRHAVNQQRSCLNRFIDSLRVEFRTPDQNESDQVVLLKKTVQTLRGELVESHRTADELDEQKQTLDSTIQSLRSFIQALETRSNNQIAFLRRANEEQKEAIRSLQSDMHAQEISSNNGFSLLERTTRVLQVELAESQRKADSLMRINHVHEQMYQCDILFSQGCIHDAAESLSEITNIIDEDVRNDRLLNGWLPEFTDRCMRGLEKIGDEALNAGKGDEAVAAYSIMLSIGSSRQNTALVKWATTALVSGSVQDVLSAATKFKHPMFLVYRVICDALQGNGRLTEAITCFHRVRNELPDDASTHDERMQWDRDFQWRCVQQLEKLGDAARNLRKHEALAYYSDLLSLDPANLGVLLKYSNEFIELNPSSHEGYKGKHAALHGVGHYCEAFEAFQTMLSKLEQSPDSNIRELRSQYVDATSAIQDEVKRAIQDLPTLLIDTETGCLYDKGQQADAFEALPLYNELRSSMTTRLDLSRIQTEVTKFYQYVMLSHRWQPHEPTFQQVESTSIYKLPLSLTFSKLQNFCKIACSFRFKWAWSDTCCINQADRGARQESVVAMFRWYRGSSLTIIYLLDVFSESQEINCLRRSIWNSRGWTYQEYIASKVVQFYTNDWKPYLGLQIFNHKESLDILSEMEPTVNYTTKSLPTLHPGLDNVRAKLYLASMRQTTREEDTAYSLFGIFNLTLPVIYGEGLQAVGRLLEHILTHSGDITLLAWTGNSGSHYSHLPIDLTVYNQITPPHIPPPLDPAEMDAMTVALQSSLLDTSLSIPLYNRLYDLPPLSLVSGRLRLHGIVFPLTDLVPFPFTEFEPKLVAYHATTPMLGDIVINTTFNLSGTSNLFLIHPWISPLLDQDFSCGTPQYGLATRALRLIVRLRQPFGALLLAPSARAQYRRVATDSLIMVRIRNQVSLAELIDAIRTVDVQ